MVGGTSNVDFNETSNMSEFADGVTLNADRLGEEFLFVRKVVVERRLGAAARLDDLTNRGCRIALLGEQTSRRLENLFSQISARARPARTSPAICRSPPGSTSTTWIRI